MKLFSTGQNKKAFVFLLFLNTVFALGQNLSDGVPQEPFAVPVITREEAIEVNKEAISFLNGKDRTKDDSNNPLQGTLSGFQQITTNMEPFAVPIITNEQAEEANKEAKSYINKELFKYKTVAFLRKIGITRNTLSILIFLIPILLISDIIRRKKSSGEKKAKIWDYLSLQRRILILFPILLLVFGLVIFVPWSVYFGNHTQFPFIFQDFVNRDILIYTISSCVLTLLLLIIPPIISNYLVGIIAGLGVCVYLQVMFMNCFLGEMNGNEPEWNQHLFWGVVNIVIWIVILSVPVFLKRKYPSFFSKVIMPTTAIILILEITATASMLLAAQDSVWERKNNYFCDGSNQFQLSKEKNVIVFIFDTLGSNFVRLCFEQSPQTKDIVKDFIWYSDARSNYKFTFPGLHHELTGHIVEPAKDLYDLYRRSWESASSKSFYKQLKENGYDARIYLSNTSKILGQEESFHEYFSNVTPKDIYYIIDYDLLRHCLIDISGFSASPFLLKKYFFYGDDFAKDVVEQHVDQISYDDATLPINNQQYYKKMMSKGITTDANAPIFAFHYTRGSHKPWTIDEKCQTHDTPFDGPVPTVKSCFHIVSEFIRMLKEKQIYDQTAILICSDHGGNDSNLSTPYDMTLMIKPFNSNNETITIDNTTKIQSIDILPSLLEMACGDKADFDSFEGFPPSRIPAERKRTAFVAFKHPDIPKFSMRDSNMTSNCFVEYSLEDVNNINWKKAFIRYMPLNKDAKVDESVLTTYYGSSK